MRCSVACAAVQINLPGSHFRRDDIEAQAVACCFMQTSIWFRGLEGECGAGCVASARVSYLPARARLEGILETASGKGP